MQYTVVHSKDPYLLARLATDLQMSGALNHVSCDYWHPFKEDCKPQTYLRYYCNLFTFHNHPCNLSIKSGATPLNLTSRNYIKVLTQILEP